jgi:hypothetical protein
MLSSGMATLGLAGIDRSSCLDFSNMSACTAPNKDDVKLAK